MRLRYGSFSRYRRQACQKYQLLFQTRIQRCYKLKLKLVSYSKSGDRVCLARKAAVDRYIWSAQHCESWSREKKSDSAKHVVGCFRTFRTVRAVVGQSDYASIDRYRAFLCRTLKHVEHQLESRPEYCGPFVFSEWSASGSRSHFLE